MNAEECFKGTPVIVSDSNKHTRSYSFQNPGLSHSRGNSSREGTCSFRGSRGRGGVNDSSYTSYNSKKTVGFQGVKSIPRGNIRGGHWETYKSTRGNSHGVARGGSAYKGDRSASANYYPRKWPTTSASSGEVSLSRVLIKRKISKKMYQQILGSINFLAPYTEEGKAHLRRVIIAAPKFNRSGKALLRADFRQQLQWWTQEHFLSRPTPISLPPPHLTIWSDASNSGWGGSLLPRTQCLGDVVPGRVEKSHQCVWMPRSYQVPPSDQASPKHSHNQMWQYDSSLSYQQAGLEQESSPQCSIRGNSPTLSEEQLDAPGAPHPGALQFMGRFPVKESYHKSRVDSHSKVIQENNQNPQTSNRSVCSPVQCQTSEFRWSLSSPIRDSSQCDVNQL